MKKLLTFAFYAIAILIGGLFVHQGFTAPIEGGLGWGLVIGFFVGVMFGTHKTDEAWKIRHESEMQEAARIASDLVVAVSNHPDTGRIK